MQYKDYYKILGVNRNASKDEIKRAYRKLARKYHPDVSKEADAEARFKEINEAHEVLKDAEKRAAYDALGSHWKAGQEYRPPPGGGAYGQEFHFDAGDAAQFSDFFSSIFGGMGGGRGHASGAGFRMRGRDEHAKILIGLEDAFHGATRKLQLEVPEVDAQGRVTRHTKTLNVRIPAGITQGQQIRLAGQGQPGAGGGANGDLYLEVEIQPHPFYELDGKDIYLHLPVAPWEAALGATVSTPTLGGPVQLKIPPGSQSGRKLRLKGRGLPGRPAGDQYVILEIVIPPAKDDKARRFYRRMAEEMPFDPRAQLGV